MEHIAAELLTSPKPPTEIVESDTDSIEALLQEAQALIDDCRTSREPTLPSADYIAEFEAMAERELADDSFVEPPSASPPRWSLDNPHGQQDIHEATLNRHEDIVMIEDDINIIPVVDLCTPRNINRIVPRRNRNQMTSEPEPIVILSDDDSPIAEPPTYSKSQKLNRQNAKSCPLPQSQSPVASQSYQCGNDEGSTCPICIDSLKNKSISATQCGHVFCTPCITTSFRMKPQCPLCNKKLKRSMIHPLFFNM